MDMKKEKFVRRFLVSKIFLLLGVVILGFLFFTLGKKFMEGREIKNEIKATEDEIARLEAKNSELDDLFGYLNTEAFLEQEAREKFNLQKEGESVMIIPGSAEENENKHLACAAEDTDNKNSNPNRWWNYFFSQ
jgi:cell division protein FtsB